MRYYVTVAGAEVPVDVSPQPGGGYRVAVNGGEGREADVVVTGGALSIRLGGRVFDLMIEGTPPDLGVVGGGQRAYARVESERARALHAAAGRRPGGGDAMITSPMPGRVLKVLVAVGDEVALGQSVAVVEAMKMENELKATRAGKVVEVLVAAGATVEAGAKLVKLA